MMLNPKLNRSYKGSSDIKKYSFIKKLSEGTFGEVWLGQSKADAQRTSQNVALKKIIFHSEKEGFPITAMREIRILKKLRHRNILPLLEMTVRKSEFMRARPVHYMVTPYMEHDLSGLLDNRNVTLSISQIKCFLLQLLEGVAYLHDSQIIHRDMKAANLLIGNDGILRIADFGLARKILENPPRPGHGCGEGSQEYTGLVVTRWYRPPELLLGLRKYTTAVDMWGVGCVLGEMFKRRPILMGSCDMNQLHLIFELVGYPDDLSMPGWLDLKGSSKIQNFERHPANIDDRFSELGNSGIDLLKRLLDLDWKRRTNSRDAIRHPYFWQAPLASKPCDLPRYEDSHELDRKEKRDRKDVPAAPIGGLKNALSQEEF